jgi:hypothetical protein
MKCYASNQAKKVIIKDMVHLPSTKADHYRAKLVTNSALPSRFVLGRRWTDRADAEEFEPKIKEATFKNTIKITKINI